MSNPYRLTPGRLPAPPHPTPTSVSGYTLPHSKIGRAPIANPYDKFTQPEFDAWIGGITGALKRALGHDEGPLQAKQSLSEGGDIPQFRPVDFPEDSDNDGVDDSFAEIKARRAAGKGKARDPREGPGFGKTFVAQPIEVPSSDEEEEEEVEYSILHPNDSDTEEQAEDGEGEEEEEDEEYPWSTALRSQGIGSSPPEARRDEVDVDNDEYEEDEEAEYEEYDEEGESEGEQQDQDQPEDEVIELISDDEEAHIPPSQSRPTVVEEERQDEEKYYDEGDEEYDMEGAEEDEDQDNAQDNEDARARQRFEHSGEDDEDEIEEIQPVEHYSSFPPQAVEPLAAPTLHAMSVEIPDPWSGPRAYAQDYYSGGELQTSSERMDPSYLGPGDEVDDEIIAQIPLEPELVEEELRCLDTATAAEGISTTWHDPLQHAGHPVFVNQGGNDGHLGPSSMPLHHTGTSASPFREVSFARELVETAEEHYIQPPDENTSFPVQTGERDNHLLQIPDPWDGPREYAQDFYAGGDIRPTSLAHIDADHLVPEDQDHAKESQSRKEQEAEDDEIQPQDHDTAFLDDDVRVGAVEISDPWEGPETYAQDYYSSGVNGAVPTDRIDPALLSVTGEIDDEYSSFLTPFAGTPSYPVDTETEENHEDEGTDSDRFALPPAPEGIYIPPSLRARDASIPTNAEIFTVDDSDDEDAGKPVPITEYTQDEDTLEDHGDADDYELEYVDEDGMDETEKGVPAPEVASHDTHGQSALAFEQKRTGDELTTLEESKEVFSSLVDWNNPPALPAGLPTSASGHIATPSSEGEDLVASEHPAAIDSKAADGEGVVAQDHRILTEKGQSPPLHDGPATTFQPSIPEQEAAPMSEAADLNATALEDTSATSVDVTEKLAEETAIVQQPNEPSSLSSVADGDVEAVAEVPVDSAMEDAGENVVEIDQSMAATADVNEPLSPIDSQDDESKVTELDPIVEEVMSVTGSRAGTAPLPDLSLEELETHAFITEKKDTHLFIGIVEHDETTASPRETPDRGLTVEVIEERTEHAFVSHAGSPPPISILLDPTGYDEFSYEDYASSVEVDELEEEESERLNEHVFSSVVKVSAKQTGVEHRHAEERTSSLPLGDVVFTTNMEITSDAPLNPTTVEELSEGKSLPLPGALPGNTDETAALQDDVLSLPLNSAGVHGSVDVTDSYAGSEPTAHHSAAAGLMNSHTENSMIKDNLETNVVASEAFQATKSSEPSSSRQNVSEIPTFLVEPASSVLPKELDADDVNSDDGHVDALIARSTTPTQEPSRPSIAAPENVSTNQYPETVFRSPGRYTPSPPKGNASETPQAPSAISDSAARDEPSSMIDAGGVIWTQEDSEDVVQDISPRRKPQTQSKSPMNDTSSSNHRSPSPPHLSLEAPPPGPVVFPDTQLEHMRNQYAANSTDQASFSQTPLLHAPAIIEQFHQQTPALSGSWPYYLSAPGTQQLSMPVYEPVSSSPKPRKKPKTMGASPKSPKKGKKAAQHKKAHVDDPSLDFQYPSDTDGKRALSQTISEVKTMTPQNEPPKSKDVAQLSSEGDRQPTDLKGNSEDLNGQQNPIKDPSLPPVTTLESPSTILKVDGAGVPKQEPVAQKSKRTYKRKRDTSPGPGEAQLGKIDEKKKRPTKRKSKLLELEGPIPGSSNGETIYVKAKPKTTSPVEPPHTDAPTTSKETIPKAKRGLLSTQSAPLPGSSASQIVRREVLLVTRAGPPGISHRHGSDYSLTIPPAAPSFKFLPTKTPSPRKPSLLQISRQAQPSAVVQTEATSTLEAANLTSLPDTSTMPDAIPTTNATQPIEATASIAPGTAPTLSQLSPATLQTLPTLTTQTPVQLPRVIVPSSDPQTPSNITPVFKESTLPSDIPTVAPVTARPLSTPSAPAVRSMTASVGNTPASQTGTPRTTMRETRSSCRYHRISLPKEEGGPRVRFLVPGCAMTNHILMKEQEIVDHGLAPVEDAYVMIKDIESLDLDSDLISVLRVLVGHDIFRDQELFYLPSAGEQLPVKPAFRKPTPSDKLESSRHNAGSPGYSSLPGSPTFHKSSASVSGSTSSLSVLRKAQNSERSSNLGHTDSEGDSDDGDAHSKASHPGSDHKGKGKSRAKSGRKSKLSHDPDFVPTGAKRGVKRTRTEVPVAEEPSPQNKKVKAHPTAPSSLASPEKPAPPTAPPNYS